MDHSQILLPEQIREIRKALCLSQEQAGKLLGGGPSAFTKYETGLQKPSASMNSLLRILDVYPDVLSVLTGKPASEPLLKHPTPFDITGDEISSLRPQELDKLLLTLLTAEAELNYLSIRDLKIAENINAPDSGEDGRILWSNGPDNTQFLPGRFCVFQLKAREMYPGDVEKEMCVKGKEKIKPLLRSVIENHGHYIIISTKQCNQLQIKKRNNKILTVLQTNGLGAYKDQVHFMDGGKLTEWVNSNPHIALWVREKLNLRPLGNLITLEHWSSRSEHFGDFVEDPRLIKLVDRINNTAIQPQGVLRVVGLSGIGKSRLCLEALKRISTVNGNYGTLSDYVMYTELYSNGGPEDVIHLVERLSISGGRAIIVVDECPPKIHNKLKRIIQYNNSRITLITLYDEVPEWVNSETIEIEATHIQVIQQIIKNVTGAMDSTDQARIASLSDGFPDVAIRIAKESNMTGHFMDPTDGKLIDQFILGLDTRGGNQLLRSAQLLSVFDQAKLDYNFGHPNQGGNDLSIIAELDERISPDLLYEDIQELIEQKIVKNRGNFVTLQPQPIAIRLAVRRWKRWNESFWDKVLAGNIGHQLNISAAKRLGEMNATDIAKKVVRHVCRINGPFDQDDCFDHSGNVLVLSELAKSNPSSVVECIERRFKSIDDLGKLSDHVRKHLFTALSYIVFHSETFEKGASLLLQLEVARQATDLPDSSKPFAALFSSELGSTQADGQQRLQFLEEIIVDAIEKRNCAYLKCIIDALSEGLKTDWFSRMISSEIQGSRKILEPWSPISHEEWFDYVNKCLIFLGKLAQQTDDVGEKARLEIGNMIPSLVLAGFFETIEKIINDLNVVSDFRMNALRELNVTLEYSSDKIEKQLQHKINILVETLAPTSLQERVQKYLAEYPMREFGEEDQHNNDISEIAPELIEHRSILLEILPKICSGNHFRAYELGESIAQHDQSTELLAPMIDAVTNVHSDSRNYDLLLGYLNGLYVNSPDKVEDFKENAFQSSELSKVAIMICSKIGLKVHDIDLAIDAMINGILSPWDLHHWAKIFVIERVEPEKVTELIDTMIDYSGSSYVLAIAILGRILLHQPSNSSSLEFHDFGPQLDKLVMNLNRWNREKLAIPAQVQNSGIEITMIEYYLEQIVKWMLEGGRRVSDSCKFALQIAQVYVHTDQGHELNAGFSIPNSILIQLLEEFPDIVWQIIGGRIIQDYTFAQRMRFVLGDPYVIKRNHKPPIMCISEDVLLAWCHAHPEHGPSFLAQCVPFLSKDDGEITPFMVRLLNDFGDRNDVRKSVQIHMHPYHWIDSCTGHYKRLVKVFEQLSNHPNPRLRPWAREIKGKLVERLAQEKINDSDRITQGYQ
ncbi:MAG: type II toxin-antitoxin system MqsA family antitoxin [Bacteroidetes bacterium]|nr:type II toxin-antitoxin system MqsA family antitoxin [Bacteroidota bacterium]